MAAEQCPDDHLLENLIAEGRVGIRPYTSYDCATILTVNFDLLATKIKSLLSNAYLKHKPLRLHYSGESNSSIISNMTWDILSLTDFALMALYNRLRAVVKRYSSSTLVSRMNLRAPVSSGLEFPTFLSSLLSSIGSLRVTDAASDILVVYTPKHMHNYGRSFTPNPVEGHYDRLITNLRSCGIRLSPLDYDNLEGAFWTTCYLTKDQNGDSFNVIGTVHPSHYTNEDAVRSLALLDPVPLLSPFENVAMTVGYMNDKDAVNAIVDACSLPLGVPYSAKADDKETRRVGMIYDVNLYGIRRIDDDESLGIRSTSGVYIIGRGNQPIYTCYLAQRITANEMEILLGRRLLAP